MWWNKEEEMLYINKEWEEFGEGKVKMKWEGWEIFFMVGLVILFWVCLVGIYFL